MAKDSTCTIKIKGTLAVSGFGIHCIVYAPLADTRFHSSGGEIIGLAKLTGLMSLDVRTYDDTNLIYLPDGGSLGQRATEFESHAVFGVDPRDPNFIIAPDIYNQIIKVSHDGGVSWTTDKNLTEEVTKRGDLLLYDRDPYHMQITQISFDPYNERRILIGTRDSGIIVSENSGTSWWTLKDSEQITYITGFFFARDNSVIVSSYGRGLWKIDLNPPFPFERYCDGDCTIRFPFKLGPAEEPPDWIDKDVIVFLKGRINGIVLSRRKVKKVTVSPGTIFKRYRGETQEYHKIDIKESKRGMGFKGMKGVIAAIQKGEVVKALIIKENELFGIISGQQEFSDMH